MKKYDITLGNPFDNKTFTKAFIGAMAIFATVAGTYAFTNKYTVDFQSPILFQSPVIVEDRLIQVEIKEATPEPTIEVREKVSFAPSTRLVAHTEQRPAVYARIVKKFGDESMKYGELISKEAGLNPQAINPTSGACGLAQALPCEKMACDLVDVDCQLDWIGEDVERRYGNIDNALAFHQVNNCMEKLQDNV